MRHLAPLALVLGLAVGCSTAQADERAEQVRQQAAELAAEGDLLRAAELLNREAEREDLDDSTRRDLLAAAASRYAEVGRDRLALATAERAQEIETSDELSALMDRMRERLQHAQPPRPPRAPGDRPFARAPVATGGGAGGRFPAPRQDVDRRLERLERSLAELRALLERHGVAPDDRRRAEERLRGRIGAAGPPRPPALIEPGRSDRVRASGSFRLPDRLAPRHARVTELRVRQGELQRQLEQSRRSLEEAEKRLVELRSVPNPETEPELAQVEQRVTELRRSAADAEAQLAEAAARFADAQRRLEAVRERTVETGEGRVTFTDARQARLASLRNRLDVERTRRSTLHRELTTYHERLAKLRAEGELEEEDGTLTSLRRLVARRETEIEGLEQRIRRLEAEVETAQAELARRPTLPPAEVVFEQPAGASAGPARELRAELEQLRKENERLRRELEEQRARSR